MHKSCFFSGKHPCHASFSIISTTTGVGITIDKSAADRTLGIKNAKLKMFSERQSCHFLFLLAASQGVYGGVPRTVFTRQRTRVCIPLVAVKLSKNMLYFSVLTCSNLNIIRWRTYCFGRVHAAKGSLAHTSTW